MGRKAKLVKNTLILSIGTILPKISVFITLPIMTGYLTKEEYGTFDLVFIIFSSFLPLIPLNIRSAAFRFLIDVRDDKSKITSIISNTLIFSLGVSLLVLPFFFFYVPNTFYLRILICIYMFTSLMTSTI